MHKFNQYTDGVARLKGFPGATSKELAHYVVPNLKEKSFHTSLIHVEINNLMDQSELQQQLVLQNIMKTAHQCKDHGVKQIILSSVVVTGRVRADVLIHFNGSLNNLCGANGFCFVNNDNISEGNLYIDRLHLLEAGKRILANNFINGINNNYFLLKHRQKKLFLTKDTNKDTHSIDCTDLQTLKKNRLNYPRNPLIGYININSIRNKIFDIR